MMKHLTLHFLPRSTDLALLLLRLWLGLSMLILHGWQKFEQLIQGNFKFADPLHIGEAPTLVLAVTFEVLGSVLLILGLAGRLAALLLASTMVVAFVITHSMKLTGTFNGELAFIYLAGYLVIFIAGAGKYSVTR